MSTNNTANKKNQDCNSLLTIKQHNQPLHESVRQAIENYLTQLKGEEPQNLYELVLNEIEEPLMRAVMGFANKNQSRAAIALGISRGTLRKKLKTHGMLD